MKEALLQHYSLLKNKESYLLLFEEKKSSIRPNKFASGKLPSRRILLTEFLPL